MADSETLPIRMSGNYADQSIEFVCAIVDEGMNFLTNTTLEFAAKNRLLDLEGVVGSTITLEMDTPHDGTREFTGICVSAEYLGIHSGITHFSAEIRPSLWFLTRTQNARVFQHKSAPDIIQDILSEYGIWTSVKKQLSATYLSREYCVQYRETDLDFLHRLMEEEGIYYFYVPVSGGTIDIILTDSASGHKPVEGETKLQFIDHDFRGVHQKSCIYEWNGSERVVTGKVTLNDYNFEKPKAKMQSLSVIPKETHSEKKHEFYDYPGLYRETDDGDQYARVVMESNAIEFQTWTGISNVSRIGVGRTFKVLNHPRTSDSVEFLVTNAKHFLCLNSVEKTVVEAKIFLINRLEFDPNDDGPYRVVFNAVPDKVQYRAPMITKWPEISGVQTAVVTGPAGEEIYTDKYGRIRIQFHWDREGKNDDKSSCWVRTMLPWTGKNWGMIAIPRIGQEVVVQFEEGNPDRPLVVGMLYNAETMPPYKLPDKMTQSGVKTDSTKGGGGFNELMFEDKKGAELVRFQSQLNYQQIVRNDATITVGLEAKDKGDMALTVQNDLTEIVKEGDHTFEVEKGDQDISITKGSQKIKVKKNFTETVEGKATQTITGNVARTVKSGNVTEDVKKGNVTRTVDMGNVTDTLKLGNFALDASLGKISMTALQKIELKCGASSIELTQSGITIKGVMVNIEGMAMAELKSPLTQVKGDGVLIVKGGITLIN